MPGGQTHTHTRVWPAPHGIQVKNVPFRWNTSSKPPWALCIHNKHTHTLLRTFYASAVTLRPLSIVVLFPGSTSLPVLFPEIAFQAWNPQPFTSLEKHLCYLVPKLLKNKSHNVFFLFLLFSYSSCQLISNCLSMEAPLSAAAAGAHDNNTQRDHASVHCCLENLEHWVLWDCRCLHAKMCGGCRGHNNDHNRDESETTTDHQDWSGNSFIQFSGNASGLHEQIWMRPNLAKQ